MSLKETTQRTATIPMEEYEGLVEIKNELESGKHAAQVYTDYNGIRSIRFLSKDETVELLLGEIRMRDERIKEISTAELFTKYKHLKIKDVASWSVRKFKRFRRESNNPLRFPFKLNF